MVRPVSLYTDVYICSRIKEEQSKVKAGPSKPLDDDDPYNVPTDEENEENGNDVVIPGGALPELPNFLEKKHFFLEPRLTGPERRIFFRYITAYAG